VASQYLEKSAKHNEFLINAKMNSNLGTLVAQRAELRFQLLYALQHHHSHCWQNPSDE
jgi:hypothetical protein